VSSHFPSSGEKEKPVIKQGSSGAHVSVIVSPRASKSEVMGVYDGALKVRITAAPVDGAANEKLITTLARFFSAPKSSISIARGEASRRKTVYLKGMSVAKALEVISYHDR